jgi:cytochrome c oxidase subunit 3
MVSPPITKDRVGDRWDGGAPPQFGGGGGGGSGLPDYGGRLHRARLGLAVGLAPILMLFLSFTAVFVVRQGWLFPDNNDLDAAARYPISLPLPWTLLAVNTVVLVLSSVTMECARRAAIRRAALAPVRSIPGVSLGSETRVPWLAITTGLGLLFLAGQARAWHDLERLGFYLATTSSSSFAYLLTGMHAVHLAGGITVLIYAVVVSRRRAPEAQRITVDVASWYWHFMAGLWIYILGLLLLMR